ncbi:HsdM family class I SAM-dependent methyltransferase [Fluviicola taffensis]|uniref:site-specific DNA-methyltransferase (adenine-specific) n=1 Tax=Fluviicola taffensis (strain DSM 16823 / NCIMB 13979 / RW262) TaxID=755732 RepID=F2IJU9_FLUTR|nr:N-6 DNA methylase [Fluviicola taffensis]AEA45008.1 N-6 DNA methylase [Fluviicola taffensis DSM 16823]
MNKELQTYLKSYSYDPIKVNKLIVSNFLNANSKDKVKGKLLSSLRIKKNSPDFKLVEEFSRIHTLRSIEDLIEAFEFVISPQEKIVSGAVYTPESIRDYIITSTLSNTNDLTGVNLCDPACGCAGFLYTAAKYLKQQTGRTYKQIYRDNIFGLDIQEYSIERSKILLSLAALLEGEDVDFDFNLFTGNALSFNWNEEITGFEGFHVIAGNPPYVCSRNIDDESKDLLQNWQVCSTGHPDLYIPFFELGMTYLRPGGILGYITMNSFFKSINGRAVREYLAQFDNTIIDFGGYQVFNSKSTYTCICFIQNRASDTLNYAKLNSLEALNENIQFQTISIEELDHFNGWNLQEIELLNRIESVGTPLGDKFKTRNGIATLKNNIYIFKPIEEDENFYYLQNGHVYPIERGICTDIINSNKFTKQSSVDAIREKAIFPYRYVDNNVQLIDEQEFRDAYPMAYQYLRDKQKILADRDKGKGKYEKWYAYGRNQSLEKMPFKLFFPHISSTSPNFVENEEQNLLFYNGLALVAKTREEIQVMRKVLGSRLFWFYVTKSSKPYGSGYFSLSRNYIKGFGIYPFDKKEIAFLIKEKNQKKINEFIEERYKVDLSEN